MSVIADNIRRLLDEINETAEACGRDPGEITLVAVTKTRTAGEIDLALGAGIEHIGENRVREAESKISGVHGRAVWHMVGHLQSNKAGKAVAVFDWIDSVDSEKLADVLSKRAAQTGKTLEVLVQVNISGEASKSGVEPEEVQRLVSYVNEKSGLEVRGLMTIGSFGVPEDVTRAEFAGMKELFEKIRGSGEAGSRFDVLSMGMSGDYKIAVREGSTMLRIGTAIFGPRSDRVR